MKILAIGRNRVYRLKKSYKGVPPKTPLRLVSFGERSVTAEFAHKGQLIERNLLYLMSFQDCVNYLSVVRSASISIDPEWEVK